MALDVSGKFVYEKGLTKKDEIYIETLAGIKRLNLNIEGEKVKTVTVDMGKPIFSPNNIPVVSREEIVKNLEIRAMDKIFKFTCLYIGNPHAVTIINDLDSFDVQKYGPFIEMDGYFPNKTNVEFVELVDKKNIRMRAWERGIGETLACGTGACAAAVACMINNYTTNKVDVELLGGNLEVEWNREDEHVYMTGPVETVYDGKIDNDFLIEELRKIKE